MRHGGDVAVRVVAVAVGCRSDRGGSQAVGGGRVIGFVIGVTAGPAPVGGDMVDGPEVAHLVVGVMLDISAHCLAVGGQRHVGPGAVVPSGLWLTNLPDV